VKKQSQGRLGVEAVEPDFLNLGDDPDSNLFIADALTQFLAVDQINRWSGRDGSPARRLGESPQRHQDSPFRPAAAASRWNRATTSLLTVDAGP
jgi:hypothetical protein